MEDQARKIAGLAEAVENHGYYFAVLTLLVILSVIIQIAIAIWPRVGQNQFEIQLAALAFGFLATYVALGMLSAGRSSWKLVVVLLAITGGSAGATIAFRMLGYFVSLGATLPYVLGLFLGIVIQRILLYGSEATTGKLQTFLKDFSKL